MKFSKKYLPWILPLCALGIGGIMYLTQQNNLGGVLMLLLAVLSYGVYVIDAKCLVDLRALLSLSWLGGVGLASFRLSNMHTDWTRDTWISFLGFYVITLYAYEITMFLLKQKSRVTEKSSVSEGKRKQLETNLYRLIFLSAGISFTCFALEVLKLRYIPLFAKFTHAYNYFHVTGLHYFTFSSMMVHAVTTLYIMLRGFSNLTGKEKRNILIANLVALSIPILCISKLQFLLIFFLPAFMILRFLKFEKLSELPWKKILVITGVIVLIGVGAGILFTARRNYAPGYLNAVFEMRNENMPMMGQYLYMYSSHNFANFNYLTQNITEYSHGLRQGFPLFALTGLKFLFPDVTRFESYLIKPELSTLTMIYDAYFDFGLWGVIGFSVLLGVALAATVYFFQKKREQNPIIYLFYCEFAVYMLLSFFDTWFSNPTTWFWFAITGVMYWYVGHTKRKENK